MNAPPNRPARRPGHANILGGSATDTAAIDVRLADRAVGNAEEIERGRRALRFREDSQV